MKLMINENIICYYVCSTEQHAAIAITAAVLFATSLISLITLDVVSTCVHKTVYRSRNN